MFNFMLMHIIRDHIGRHIYILQYTSFLPSNICISLDSPSSLNNHILVVLDRFLKSVIKLTIQVPTHWMVPSSTPGQMDLAFVVMEQDFALNKILPGMPHVLCVDKEQ